MTTLIIMKHCSCKDVQGADVLLFCLTVLLILLNFLKYMVDKTSAVKGLSWPNGSPDGIYTIFPILTTQGMNRENNQEINR